jgi:hypothetical protein
MCSWIPLLSEEDWLPSPELSVQENILKFIGIFRKSGEKDV